MTTSKIKLYLWHNPRFTVIKPTIIFDDMNEQGKKLAEFFYNNMAAEQYDALLHEMKRQTEEDSNKWTK